MLVGAFSVITNLRMDLFVALILRCSPLTGSCCQPTAPCCGGCWRAWTRWPPSCSCSGAGARRWPASSPSSTPAPSPSRGQRSPASSGSSASKSCNRRFVITEKAPTRAFSWVKAATTAFTFKTLLRHYAKRGLTPRSLNVKLGPRRKGHKRRAVWLA